MHSSRGVQLPSHLRENGEGEGRGEGHVPPPFPLVRCDGLFLVTRLPVVGRLRLLGYFPVFAFL